MPPSGQPPAWTPYPNQWPAPAPPRKRRVGLLVAAIALPVVLVVGGVVTAGLLLAHRSSSSTPGTLTASERSVTLSAPERIGSLRRSTDQSIAEQVRSSLSGAGLKQPFAVVYEDTSATGRQTVMWGGVSRVFRYGQEQQLPAFIKSAASSLGGDATVETMVDVDPGSTGGHAKCAKVDGTGARMTVCAWNGADALIGFLFVDVNPDQAGAEVRTILPAVVH